MNNDNIVKKNNSFDLKEQGDVILNNHEFYKDLSD